MLAQQAEAAPRPGEERTVAVSTTASTATVAPSGLLREFLTLLLRGRPEVMNPSVLSNADNYSRDGEEHSRSRYLLRCGCLYTVISYDYPRMWVLLLMGFVGLWAIWVVTQKERLIENESWLDCQGGGQYVHVFLTVVMLLLYARWR